MIKVKFNMWVKYYGLGSSSIRARVFQGKGGGLRDTGIQMPMITSNQPKTHGLTSIT